MPHHVSAGVRDLREVRIGVFPGIQKVGILLRRGLDVAGFFLAERDAIERVTGTRALEERPLASGLRAGEISSRHQCGRFAFAHGPDVERGLVLFKRLLIAGRFGKHLPGLGGLPSTVSTDPRSSSDMTESILMSGSM